MLAAELEQQFGTSEAIRQFLTLELPEPTVRELLQELTPENVDSGLFGRLLNELIALGQIPSELQHYAQSMDLMDCCGTGGSGLPHYNTSTTVAFVLAAAGIKTIKFGNRAASSQSGSFDFLEALGVPFGLPLEKLIEITEFSGLAFLFAPQVYPALAKFQALRKSVGRRTVFNFLGPLLNPLRPAYRLTGVSDAKMQRQMASYLAEHPVNRTQAWLVRSEDGLDEFSLKAPNLYLSVRGNQIQEHSWVDPPAQSGPALTFSCPSENVRYFHALVCGEDTRSEVYRMVCLNAAAGLVVAGQADSIATGREIVVDLLAKGAVRETFARCRRAYEQAAG